MITRIKINGFKSLLETELYFGPFTCIAGANAAGKSNFFDALMFLSSLADNTVLQAAKSIRSEGQKHSNIKDIFFKSGSGYYDTMSFEVDMLVPKKAEDDLGQMAEAKITSLKYILELKLNDDTNDKQPIEIIREELLPINLGNAKKSLLFNFSKDWLKTVLIGKRAGTPFISTAGEKIKLHSDSIHKRGGRTTESIAKKMPRTLLSTVTAESPTAFLARQEMRNWIMLQFEPSSLRQPNYIYEIKNAEITSNGLNLPATLYRLKAEKPEEDVFQSLTNKLKYLVNEVENIDVDKDEKRDLLTLQIQFKGGLVLPAQSLSDGTLRFLGLAVIKEDSKRGGIICLEEPENGINPKKVEEMIKLLEEIATDTDFEVDDDNPLRQVIINSHSPIVVRTVSDESLYLATEKEIFSEKFQRKVNYTSFSALKNTWKTDKKLVETTSIGEITAYLEKGTSENSTETNALLEPQVVYSIMTKSHNKRTVEENINQCKLLF